jgi:hypothetical protein
MAKEPKRRFILDWRNRFLTVDDTSIEEMADSLEAAAARLREMAEEGIQLAEDSGMEDDHALLVTYDESVADAFEFEEDENGLEPDEDDESR